MVTPPIPDWDTNRLNYWIVRYCRGASLITVFLVGLILQVGFTRVLPFSLATAFGILLLGHALTRWRYVPIESLKAVFTPSSWFSGTRAFIICYVLLVGWMAMSFVWSPLPQYAFRDVSLLLIFLPFAHFMAIEQATNSNREFVLTVIGGVLIVSVLVSLELNGVTRFLELTSERNRHYDLNRVTILLALLCWVPLLFIKQRPLDWFLCTICIVFAGAANFMASGESAKLSFICAAIVGLIVYLLPSTSRIIAISMALGILIFPFILPKISAPLQNESMMFLKQGHAHHRIATWLGYKSIVDQRPIIGWGSRADRYLGLRGLAPPVDPENKYSKRTTGSHNFILEIWVNWGLIGAALVAGIILALERRLNGLRRDQKIVGMQLLTGAFVYSCVATSFLQGWWLAALATVLIAFIVACRQAGTIGVRA